MQKTSPGVQVLLTTHDDQFLDQLSVLGVTGRRALICSASEEFGHIAILEGDQLQRKWDVTLKEKTPASAKGYIAAVREFAEGMLKLMLRGIDPSIPTSVLGDCRARIEELHDRGVEPWNLPAFSTLVSALAKGSKEIKWMEQSHHSGLTLTMTEASDVEVHWRKKLRPALERGFRIIRDHRSLHGGLVDLHAFAPSIVLPNGYKAKVREFPLQILGTAAALTDGRIADGCVELTLTGGPLPIKLEDHFVFRLTSRTLEPVARPGDLLIVSDHATATPLSLVLALDEDRILARRFQVAENHTDVAVLTASAINPRRTAPPVVAKITTLTMKKVVGVLYGSPKTINSQISEVEIAECGGESEVTSFLGSVQGLVEVSGSSAEPMALDRQYLLVGSPMSVKEAEQALDGRPVIAEASDGGQYFKRLRVEANDLILESLEIGGDFPPIVLARSPGLLRHLTGIRPVLGVLFEMP